MDLALLPRLFAHALRLSASAALALCVCAGALAQGPALDVDIGAPPELKKLLEDNLDIVRWSRRGGLTPGQIEQLVEAGAAQAREIAATEGYFEPRITRSLVRNDDVWSVRLDVQPGPSVVITEVRLDVTGPITGDPGGVARIEAARRAFGLAPGQRFRQPDWDAAKARALHSITQKRYATAEVASSRADIDPAARSARLRLVIDSGPSVTFGPLRIDGLQRYPESVVRNLSPVERGALYDEAVLARFQRRLLLTGQFGSALVGATPSRTQPREVPVVVSLVEAKARRVEVGAGYGTDRGPRMQVAYRDHDMLDRAWRFSANLAVDKLVQEGNAAITFPRDADGIHYAVEAKARDEYIQGQDILNWSLTGARIYAIEEYESAASLQYLTERSKLKDGPRDVREALFVNQRWLWDRMDDPLNPRRGATFQFQAGGALEPLLSARSFGRLHVKANALKPLGEGFTIALRGEAGAVLAQSRRDIPSAYVFRTGGDTSIRGYAYDSLGVPESNAIVGGRYLLVGSLELIRWLNPQWGMAAFIDGGNAWDALDRLTVVYGYGVGVRWRAPVGNLSLDVARGEATGEMRIHFNAGVVFR